MFHDFRIQEQQTKLLSLPFPLMMTPPPPGHILDEFRVEETPCKGICSQFNRKNGEGGEMHQAPSEPVIFLHLQCSFSALVREGAVRTHTERRLRA